MIFICHTVAIKVDSFYVCGCVIAQQIYYVCLCIVKVFVTDWDAKLVRDSVLCGMKLAFICGFG